MTAWPFVLATACFFAVLAGVGLGVLAVIEWLSDEAES